METNEYVVQITVQGEVIVLYDDDRKSMVDGKMTIKRASNIRFNEDIQAWEIFRIGVDEKEHKIGSSYPDRRDAIDAEISILNQMLLEGNVKMDFTS